jgi:hypothetical protein
MSVVLDTVRLVASAMDSAVEPAEGPRFWQLVERYPRTERARGYLDGVSAAANLPIADDLADDTETADDQATA